MSIIWDSKRKASAVYQFQQRETFKLNVKSAKLKTILSCLQTVSSILHTTGTTTDEWISPCYLWELCDDFLVERILKVKIFSGGFSFYN